MSKTIDFSFKFRRTIIPDSGIIWLHTKQGKTRAEYMPGSERFVSGNWHYSLYVQEQDLSGTLNLTNFGNCDLVAPFASSASKQDELPPCWAEVPVAEEYDDILVLVEDACGRKCVHRAPKSDCCTSMPCATSVLGNE